MRAAVVHQPGAIPVLEQFTDPQPRPGVSVGTLVAAALNPLDLAFVDKAGASCRLARYQDRMPTDTGLPWRVRSSAGQLRASVAR
jgi:NADPH:quinone reductase-like Zn-dependent oxidoreductase